MTFYPPKLCSFCSQSFQVPRKGGLFRYVWQLTCSLVCSHAQRVYVAADPERQRFNFWRWVRFAGLDDCWLWKGSLNNKGYGMFHPAFGEPAKIVSAHRYAWLISFGPIPDGVLVLHKCDVRACCNPQHLWLGTAKDNTQDALQKGRLVMPQGAH